MKLKTLLVLLLAILLAPKPTRATPQIYKTYVPLVFSNARFLAPDPRFSLQGGWGDDCCETNAGILELTLGISGNQHRLLSQDGLETFQLKEWYTWWNSNNQTQIPPHPCIYEVSANSIPQSADCAAWIGANLGKVWVIGNEPNLGYAAGGNNLTPLQYAEMWHQAKMLIKSADPEATLVTAAYVFDPCSPQDNGFSEWQNIHQNTYGAIGQNGWGYHYYQVSTPDDAIARQQLACFSNRVSGNIWITELGWNGNDSNNTQTNVRDFMRNFIPYLKTQPRVARWYWWQWGAGSVLVQNGLPTIAGACYSSLANGGAC